jgi:hypothetical protein
MLGGAVAKKGEHSGLDAVVALGALAAMDAAGRTARMEQEQLHALYRFEAPILDVESSQVAGRGLVTGVDVQRFGWPAQISFSGHGSCRWSEVRAAYVPWPGPVPKAWGNGRKFISFVAWAAGLISILVVADGVAVGAIVLALALGWIFWAFLAKADLKSRNAQAIRDDAERWRLSEARGHAPNAGAGEASVPSGRSDGHERESPNALDYQGFLSQMHGLMGERVRLVFTHERDLGTLRGGFAVGYLRVAAERDHAERSRNPDTIAFILTDSPESLNSIGGFVISPASFRTARRLPENALLVQDGDTMVGIVPEDAAHTLEHTQAPSQGDGVTDAQPPQTGTIGPADSAAPLGPDQSAGEATEERTESADSSASSYRADTEPGSGTATLRVFVAACLAAIVAVLVYAWHSSTMPPPVPAAAQCRTGLSNGKSFINRNLGSPITTFQAFGRPHGWDHGRCTASVVTAAGRKFDIYYPPSGYGDWTWSPSTYP